MTNLWVRHYAAGHESKRRVKRRISTNQVIPAMNSRLFLTLLLPFAAMNSQVNAAYTLVSGGAMIDYDAAAWASLAGGANLPGFEALIMDEFFDQAGVTSRTGTQILNDEVVANPATTGLYHAMNGSTVSNLANRSNQATTFAYEVGNPTGHTGVIGLGGITRWDVNPLLGGGHLGFGDYTLSYDPTRVLVGGTGWALRVNMAGGGVAFDLKNVTVNATASAFDISGDLAVSYEMANFYLATPANQGNDVGNFSFSAIAVPEPSRALTMFVGVVALGFRRRRPQGLPTLETGDLARHARGLSIGATLPSSGSVYQHQRVTS